MTTQNNYGQKKKNEVTGILGKKKAKLSFQSIENQSNKSCNNDCCSPSLIPQQAAPKL